MRVTVRLFAGLAERAGRRSLDLDLPDGATAEDAWRLLVSAQFPEGAPLPAGAVRVAVNLQYTSWEHALVEGDELAFIPPVAGGNGVHGPGTPAPVRVVLTESILGVDPVVASLGAPDVGATAVFVGTVRQWTHLAGGDRRTLDIRYEAYEEMARREMEAIGAEVRARWPDTRVALAHRLGLLVPGDVSLIVAIASPHRNAALEAAAWATEELKRRVPIWKKERWEGGEEWVGWGA